MMTTPAPIHVPVLLQEVLANLVLPPAARVLDLTLGLGGHAEALLATTGALLAGTPGASPCAPGAEATDTCAPGAATACFCCAARWGTPT